jgi:hypothetical protein
MTMQIYMLYNMFSKFFRLYLPYTITFNFFTHKENDAIYLYINNIHKNI